MRQYDIVFINSVDDQYPTLLGRGYAILEIVSNGAWVVVL
jgi:hypothetical protein